MLFLPSAFLLDTSCSVHSCCLLAIVNGFGTCLGFKPVVFLSSFTFFCFFLFVSCFIPRLLLLLLLLLAPLTLFVSPSSFSLLVFVPRPYSLAQWVGLGTFHHSTLLGVPTCWCYDRFVQFKLAISVLQSVGCCFLLHVAFGSCSFSDYLGPATTQNLVVKFDGEICSGVLVENASDRTFPSKRSSKISCQTSPEVRHQFRRKLR